MRPFNQNENAYTATAKNVTFPAITTTTTAGSTTNVINVVSTSGFSENAAVIIGDTERSIVSLTSVSITLNEELPIAPSSGVTVALGYAYDVTKLDNPVRKKANHGIIAANIRNYQSGLHTI